MWCPFSDSLSANRLQISPSLHFCFLWSFIYSASSFQIKLIKYFYVTSWLSHTGSCFVLLCSDVTNVFRTSLSWMLVSRYGSFVCIVSFISDFLITVWKFFSFRWPFIAGLPSMTHHSFLLFRTSFFHITGYFGHCKGLIRKSDKSQVSFR